MNECDSCKLLVRKHGIHNLTKCDYCHHYYAGTYCLCTTAQIEKRIDKDLQERPEQVVFT